MSESTTPETRPVPEQRPTAETHLTAETRRTAVEPGAEPECTAEVEPTTGTPGASPVQVPVVGPATPEAAVAALAAAGPGVPFLIGVRHHAPSLAAALPALLDAAAPDVLLVELPAEFQPWLGWLAHEETEAPVALAAVPADGPGLGLAGERGPAFYPFADFSPELVALRWAAQNGVPAVACDLPLAHRAWADSGPDSSAPAPVAAEGHGLSAAIRSRLTGRDGDDLWDRLVEALAPGSAPEALRRAALLTGWALRQEAEARGGVDRTDLVRESWMRGQVAAALASGRRPAVVVGAFHTPALLTSTAGEPAPGVPHTSAAVPDPGAAGRVNGAAGTAACTVSLIPYTYPLLDSRSGYPAGIRDPEWQHIVLDAAGDPAALHEALVRTAVRVCAALREQGHPYGPAEGREIVRVAGDLARLRGLPAPGRGELLEAVQTVLGRGETYGTGRAVARALEHVLVGARTGRPAPAAPRSGLGPAVEAETAALSLPSPEDAHERTPRDLRLDPARSTLDRRRELLLRRLTVCGIPYAQEQGVTGAAGTEGLTTRWQVRWTPATAAMVTAAGARGVTPAQAAEGVLRQRHAAECAEDGPTAAQVVRGLTEAAECGLPGLADERLTELTAVLPASGTLPELLAGLDLLDRIDAGHLSVPAAPDDPSSAPDDTASPRAAHTAHAAELLTSAAVRQVHGLTGSEEPEDARALLELAQRADRLGGIRLTAALARLAADGTPLIAAAAGAVRVLTGHDEAEDFGGRVASWVDGAVDSAARAALTARLAGVLTVAGPLLTVGVGALDPLLHRVVELDDAAFLARLPALRGGFDTLSPAARERLLDTVEERLGERVDTLDADDPAELARRTVADLAARELLTGLGLPVPPPAPDDRSAPQSGHRATAHPAVTPALAPPTDPTPERTLAPADRWRLVLGRRSDRLPTGAARVASALDELYGAGRGEGSRGGLPGGGSGPGGGREPSFPGVREWSEELAALFGPGIREEVLAAAAVTGRQDVLAELDPAAATPSVELLRTILRYAGGLPEARVAALRPLVRRLVDELTRQLATQLRPALTGAMSPRPTRRPGGRLDLPRTLRANLATARRTADGTVRVIPEKPVFRSRVRRSADWRLILVTDVSGSMEASTIWSALTASVLAGVPTLSTHFLAFSTEVVDLTGYVHDPLSLLLEVSVGGGTHIAAGLRHARSLIEVPSRTLVVVISDFEEGAPLGGLLAEVRALVATGCHVLGCASLDDAGRPRYSTGVAGQLVAAGMPVAALSPLELARWDRGEDSMTAAQLPPVAPEVTATLVEDLSPRLRKRLDAAVAKLGTRPTHRDGDTLTIAVDDETELRLHAPGGVVATADAISCGCLLAPACVHRAAAACAAPTADPAPEPADRPEQTVPEPVSTTGPEPASTTDPTPTPTPATDSAASPEVASPAQRAAADALWSAGAAVLEAGTGGSGAVTQAVLLRAAHTARLRQLPRAAGAALSVVTLLRAARAGDPSYRTAELVTALAELLGTAYRVRTASGAELAAVRGRARRPYRPDGSLRLYGLFTEPVVTDSGHGGVRTWVAGSDGRLCTVGDVAPGGVGRALGVADRAVRLGDSALTHRELGRAGLAVSGATVSPDGRLGAGKGVKAVSAGGAAWTEPPLAALWETPPSEQAARALRFASRYADPEGGGSDLLFLNVELLGAVRESGGTCLLALCEGGLAVRLTVADDDPALAHRDNLMLLATAPGTRLRIIGRLVPAPHPRLTLLACSHPAGQGAIDLGFDRLRRADLPDPVAPVHLAPRQPESSGAHSPLYLLERRVEQTVPAGRAALGMLGDVTAETRRIRRAGLPTAAGLLAALCASAAQRDRDLFGRLLPADTDSFATHWLSAARYTAAVSESLCAAAWNPTRDT